MENSQKGPPLEPSEAGPVGRGGRNGAGAVLAVRRGRSRAEFLPTSGARVGCHKGTTQPLGSLANKMLRSKRVQAHRAFDGLWKRRGLKRPDAYRWLAKEMNLPMKTAHIGGFDMAQCKRVLDLCREELQKEAA